MGAHVDAAAPIGVFDSGLGGLTVAHAIRERLPGERLVYLGDTARVPYGTRSPKTVLAYARACAKKLSEHDIKLLVVACNTVSAVALDMLAVELDIPVLGVIDPGARAGVSRSQNGRIGVIATQGTVDSGAYPRAVARVDSRAETFTAAAPLFVPLAEEGWPDDDVPSQVARRYLAPLVSAGIDTLVLGCTHYPVFKRVITRELTALAGHPLPVVDSGEATAEDLAAMLQARGLVAPPREASDRLRLFVTDLPKRFSEVAGRFLGEDASTLAVEAVDL